jgi:malate dehydrogenase (oxaloacetate-decarboxylating)(NADP+)
MTEKFNLDKQLVAHALEYHQYPKAGKTEVVPTKPLNTKEDLSLAYSPGVAAPCLEIAQNETNAYKYTNKGNLVGVITNGTAVLGLGNIGAIAGKPVMEGKAVLFKKFAGIDVFDIEIKETNIDKFVDIVASLEPTFGGINLEDIKAPECFEIENKLKKRLKIPIFHDDQHGTAIVLAAGVINGLKLVNKSLGDVKIVVSGAGAAAIACLDLLVLLGANITNIFMCDSKGLIYKGRPESIDISKQKYCQDTHCRSLNEVIENADILLGLSGPGTVTQDMIIKMARDPLVFVLANPTPEIMPELVKQVRPDAIIATGRSDYPNQINNVLCFPFLFRGALDIGATCINDDMKIAVVNAIAELALMETTELINKIYDGENLSFGRDYIIPKPLDQRLIYIIPPAVVKAAIASKVNTREINDMDKYIATLKQYVYRSNMFMRPVFSSAIKNPKHVVLCEGEDERVLNATQEILDQGLAQVTLIGRPAVITARITKLGLRIVPYADFHIVNNEQDPRFKEFWTYYYASFKRQGITEEFAKREVTRNTTLIGAMMLQFGIVDSLICGTFGSFNKHLEILKDILGCNNSDKICGTMNALMLPRGSLFLLDTFVNENPTAKELSYITKMAVDMIKHFGIEPRIALLSHSSFGSNLESASAKKMRETLLLLRNMLNSNIEIDGEMHGDAALFPNILHSYMPESALRNPANLLVLPNIESAHIAYSILRVSASDGVTVGPILMGLNKPAHILDNICSVRRIVNMVALLSVEAQNMQRK